MYSTLINHGFTLHINEESLQEIKNKKITVFVIFILVARCFVNRATGRYNLNLNKQAFIKEVLGHHGHLSFGHFDVNIDDGQRRHQKQVCHNHNFKINSISEKSDVHVTKNLQIHIVINWGC